MITTLGFSQTLTGTWKMSPVASSLGVGEAQGNIGWWSNSAADVATRACYFDDEYVFNADGSFANVQGTETWLEPWQGPEGCAAPVAPHNGSNPATWVYDATAATLTLTGVGAYIGLPKVYNLGELTTPSAAPASITYKVTTFTATSLTLDIQITAGGAHWRFILEKQVPVAPTLNGTWLVKSEASAIGVGEAQGNIGWWSNSAADVATRACYFDDLYVFNTDGSFANVQGTETWLEPWQGPEGCAAPVAPHNGSNAATWTYDATVGTVTLTGVGAYVGLPKVYNLGELTTPSAAPASITYKVTTLTDTSLTLDIQITAGGAHWRFNLVKQTLGVNTFNTPKVSMYPNPTSGIVTIEAGSVIESISVYNVLGQEMLSQKGNSASETLNISNLKSGVYLVRTTSNGKTATSRIVKE